MTSTEDQRVAESVTCDQASLTQLWKKFARRLEQENKPNKGV